VADFYAARDTTTVPLPWPSIAPPFTSYTWDENFASAFGGRIQPIGNFVIEVFFRRS
jgi:hypothetical protein